MTTEEAIEVAATTEPMASSPVPTLPAAGEATSVHDQLLDFINDQGLDHDAVNAFLRHRGRITNGQTFRDLDPDYASLILAHPDRFIAAINA